jgi:hypothetical protein
MAQQALRNQSNEASIIELLSVYGTQLTTEQAEEVLQLVLKLLEDNYRIRKIEEQKDPALSRGMELATLPMWQVPFIALHFAKYLCSQVGMCGETMITAYACYAQAVEGLPCEDELYKIGKDHRAWFEEAKKRKWEL